MDSPFQATIMLLAKELPRSCTRSGQYNNKCKNPDVHPTKKRRNTSTTKIGCPFRVRANYAAGTNWTVYIVDCNHNHRPATSNSALLRHRTAALLPSEHTKVV